MVTAVTPASSPSTLMLVIQAPVHRADGRWLIDAQAHNGLRLWLQHFDHVLLFAPATGSRAPDMVDLLDGLPGDRLEVVALPRAYTPLAFARVFSSVRGRLLDGIARATHLQFAIGGSWGDWGALATILAARRNRKVAVWTDRVESAVMRAEADRYRGPRRAYRRFNAWLALHVERYAITRGAMGLFHGMDTYRAYAPISAAPHLVHDIHLGPESRIAPDQLAAKVARPDHPLRIVYAGRVHPDKGPLEWIEALALAAARIDLRADWHGDGPLLDAARRTVAARGLQELITFPGETGDRPALLAALREADIFLFCHKTPESPRCLIEALLSGTPIVGYRSAYPLDLIAGHGGGVLTPPDPAALADALVALASDRGRLAALCGAAAADGFPLVDSAVFAHRARLIRAMGGRPGT